MAEDSRVARLHKDEDIADFKKAEERALESGTEKESVKEIAYNISAAVSNAILVTIGIGLLMQSFSTFIHWGPLNHLGAITKVLMPAAFGAAVASQLKTNTMVMFSAMAASTVGANAVFFTTAPAKLSTVTGFTSPQAAGSTIMTTGQPISAIMAAIVAVLFGKWLTGKTPLDMIIVPALTTVLGTIAGYYLAIGTTPILVGMGKLVASSVAWNPVIGTACIAMLFAIFLLTPASSAALAIAIGATGVTSPVGAGAMLIGTTAAFAAYPAISWHENKIGTIIAETLVTPKIQFPNIIKNPWLLVPPLLGSAIAAPIATLMFHVTVPFELAGLGLNSLIVPIDLATHKPAMFWSYMAFGVLLPAVIAFVTYHVFRMFGWIKAGETHLDLI
ncbi:PTS sugar transporter subunit IIC [Leuconostocaceae bacterium ESL0723]|nr:PTS sugar transporter subunit IIC [Lactobacillaceae bacterium L1_55_11]WEV53929.1 PTS sugar transporter subunit IIC [Leuconostocaceae bacterium ESL0723]